MSPGMPAPAPVPAPPACCMASAACCWASFMRSKRPIRCSPFGVDWRCCVAADERSPRPVATQPHNGAARAYLRSRPAILNGMAGMTCAACSNANPEGARFCMACGTPLERRCGSCGETVPPEARFCPSCGTALDAGGAAPATPPRPAEVPAEERRQVTVLFADLSGYTAVAERMDPETVKAMVEGCLRRLGEEVERFGGTVDKYIGDNVMALFGAPVAHEDDAERAVRAALGMQE